MLTLKAPHATGEFVGIQWAAQELVLWRSPVFLDVVRRNAVIGTRTRWIVSPILVDHCGKKCDDIEGLSEIEQLCYQTGSAVLLRHSSRPSTRLSSASYCCLSALLYNLSTSGCRRSFS